MRAALAAVWLLLSVAPVSAQSMPSEDETRRLIAAALDGIHRAQCGAQPCAPTTSAEKAKPPLTVAEARQIFGRGALSGVAEYCRIDWQQTNFLPMMAYWRTTQKKTERQLALVAILHGVMQTRVRRELVLRGRPCTQRERRDVELRLPFRR